jgi:hypothetical protein
MTKKNVRGHAPINSKQIVQLVVPLLLQLEPEQIVDILSVQGKTGHTCLHKTQNVKVLKHCLPKLTPTQRMQLFSIHAGLGQFPLALDVPGTYEEVKGLLDEIKPEEILSAEEWKGYSPLLVRQFFVKTLPLLELLPPEEFVAKLTKPDINGIAPLQNRNNLSAAFPLIFKLPIEQIKQIFSLETDTTLLPFAFQDPKFSSYLDLLSNEHLYELFSIPPKKGIYGIFACAQQILPYLEKLSNEQLEALFSLKSSLNVNIGRKIGYSFLNCEYRLLYPLCKKRQIDLSKFITEEFSAADQDSFEFSPSWLTMPKYSTLLFDIPKEEYDLRLVQLKSKLDSLWKPLRFGQLHPSLLQVLDRQYTPEEIKATLIEIWDLMCEETAWLGTPVKENKEALHQFYCLMLVNLEEIVKKLEEKNNPQETAGNLINIAVPRLQGRCATAYQMEFQQIQDLLSGKQKDLDSFIKSAAYRALQKLIEIVVSHFHDGDVHAMAQYLYAAGMTPLPDALAPLTVEEAQQRILKQWDLILFSLRFLQGVPEGMDIDWLKKQTPADYSPEYLTIKEEYKQIEERIQDETKKQLNEQFPPEKAAEFLKILPEYHALSFPLDQLEHGDKASLILRAFKQTGKTLGVSLEPDAFIEDLAKFSTESLAKCTEKIEQFMQQYRQGIPKTVTYLTKFREAKNAEKTLIEWLETILKFDTRLSDLSPAQKIHFLRVMQGYEQEFKNLGEGLRQWGISYSYGKQTLADACENARQLAYHKEALQSGSRAKIVLHLLTLLGAIQKSS